MGLWCEFTHPPERLPKLCIVNRKPKMKSDGEKLGEPNGENHERKHGVMIGEMNEEMNEKANREIYGKTYCEKSASRWRWKLVYQSKNFSLNTYVYWCLCCLSRSLVARVRFSIISTTFSNSRLSRTVCLHSFNSVMRYTSSSIIGSLTPGKNNLEWHGPCNPSEASQKEVENRHQGPLCVW